MDVDPVLPRITTPGRGDVGPDHMQTEEDSTIPSSVPVSSAQSSANIPSVKGDLHNYHHVFYIPTITMRILKYVDPEDLPKISQALPAVFDVLEKCFDWSNILVNMTYQDTEDYLQMAKLKHKFKKLSLEGDCRCLLADIRKFLNCNTATLESVLLLNCVNLEILSVQFNRCLKSPQFLATMLHLTFLDMSNCWNMVCEETVTALLMCSSLKGIDVSGCTQFSSRDIINIACHLPHLSQFRAEFTSSVSFNDVCAVIQDHPDMSGLAVDPEPGSAEEWADIIESFVDVISFGKNILFNTHYTWPDYVTFDKLQY